MAFLLAEMTVSLMAEMMVLCLGLHLASVRVQHWVVSRVDQMERSLALYWVPPMDSSLVKKKEQEMVC